MLNTLKAIELRHWINLWVFVFSITVLSAAGHGGQAAIILLLTGLYVMFVKRGESDSAPLNSQEKILIGLVLVFWLIQLFGVIYQPSGYEYETLREKFKALDYPMRWLLLIPVFLLFRRYLISWRLVAVGLSIGAIIATGIAHYQVYFLGITRATGASNHFIPFAELMVAVDLLLWMFMIRAWDQRERMLSGFFLLASLAAFYSSLLSVTRGAWLAYAVMIVIWVVYTLGKSFSDIKHLFSLPVLLRLLFAGVVFFAVSQTDQYKVLQARTAQTLDGLAAGQLDAASSGRERIFKQAIESIEQHPFGIGTDNFGHPQKGHAHNELLNVWVENGMQGVIALSALILYSLYVFWRALKTDDELSRIYAASGLMLIISYAIFGQSQAPFSHNDTLMFFIFYLYLFFGQIQLLGRRQEKLFT